MFEDNVRNIQTTLYGTEEASESAVAQVRSTRVRDVSHRVHDIVYVTAALWCRSVCTYSLHLTRGIIFFRSIHDGKLIVYEGS